MNVTLQAPVRLRDFVVDGKLELSLQDYLDLVMANNTDIAISAAHPRDAEERDSARVWHLRSVRQQLASTRRARMTPDVERAGRRGDPSQPEPALQPALPADPRDGTQFISSFAWTKTSTNNAFQTFNPGDTSNSWQMGFTQPLLRNRGRYVNRLPIMIARSTSEVDRTSAFEIDAAAHPGARRRTPIGTWSTARETLKVQEQALDARRAVAEARAAGNRAGRDQPAGNLPARAAVRHARRSSLTQRPVPCCRRRRTSLRRQIGADLDPDVRKLPIVLTENVEPSADKPSRSRSPGATGAGAAART